MTAAGFDAIDAALREATDSGAVPGAVAIAATSREVIYSGAFGRRACDAPDPMTQDSMFWIASMTKAITSAAAMQLVERGSLTLDGPIGALAPDFAAPQVLDGFDDDGTPRLRPARTAITLRHLLTHTAGYCYDMWNGDMARYMEASGLPRTASGLRRALTAPLAFEPGTRWEYGINTDVVGRIVEIVSGVRLDRYLHDNIFAPLGMVDTGYSQTDDQRGRRVALHRRSADGTLATSVFSPVDDPEQHMGGGGLTGTAPDYIRFAQMILNMGRGNGNVVLQPETVAAMAQNHIGDLDVTPLPGIMPTLTNPVDLYPGMRKKWGLGFMVTTAPTPEGRSAGSLAWAGLPNCWYWIDPARDVTGVILMQVLPFVDPACMAAFAAFERGVYDAL